MKFAICNEVFQGWDLEGVLAYAARLGYAGVELAPFTLANSVRDVSAAARQRIRQAAARYQLELVGLHWLLVKPEGLSITDPDTAVRQRTAAYLCDLVDFCADVGGRRMVFGSPKQRNVPPGVTPEQARSWALASFEPAVQRAQQRDVIICLEPLSPAETNFINTASQAIDFVQLLACPHFKIILDVKAMCAEPKPIPQIIKESWPHFAHFHANDKNLRGPGFGEVDYTPIAAALKEVGYDGFISVEVFNFEEGAEAIAERSLEYLRRKFGHGQ